MPRGCEALIVLRGGKAPFAGDDPDGDIDLEGDLDEMRKVEYICTEEIRAIDKLLGTNGDPVELVRNLGISRLSQFARDWITEAMGG